MSMRHYLSCSRGLRLLAILAICIAVAASTGFAQQYKDIKVLGTSSAISRPGPKNGDELKRVFQRNRADYEKVLREANWPGNPEDLFRAVESNQFSEAQYPVGHTFEWMAVRKKGVAVASVPVRWAGTAPFEAFEIRVDSNNRAYRFLIPKACGNLSLVSEGPTEQQLRELQDQERLRALRLQQGEDSGGRVSWTRPAPTASPRSSIRAPGAPARRQSGSASSRARRPATSR
jgi:hypothetical protein